MNVIICDICNGSGAVQTGEDMGVPIYSTCICMSRGNNEVFIKSKIDFCFKFIGSDSCKKVIEYFNYNPYSPVYFKGKEGYFYGVFKGVPTFADHQFSKKLYTSEQVLIMLK